jgi:predicted RNase H-like HicB family nuclease
MRTYTVSCEWDPDAGVWYVSDSDVPGLATEASSFEALELKLQAMIPELLELNAAADPREPVPFELITRKHELARLA